MKLSKKVAKHWEKREFLLGKLLKRGLTTRQAMLELNKQFKQIEISSQGAKLK